MRCKVLLIALLSGMTSTPIFSQDQTSHQKTLTAIQELKAELIHPQKVKTTAGKLIRPNQPPTTTTSSVPQPMLVDANEPTPAVGGPMQQYRVELPQRSVLVDVPPPVIHVQQAPVQVQQSPPVVILQDNGNGNGNGPQPPINPPDPDRDIEEIRARVAQAWYINSHFKVKRGIFGLGVLPCVTLKPRLVTDPAVARYYEVQDYLRRKQVEAWIRSQYATIQPVPEPETMTYRRYR